MDFEENRNFEYHLAEAHVLITRREYGKAKALLDRLSAAGAPSAEIEPLRAQIHESWEMVPRPDDDRRQAWRYYLGLQTTARRICRFVIALGIAVYGGWNALLAIDQGRSIGFSAIIATQLRTGRYSTMDWTHPGRQRVPFHQRFSQDSPPTRRLTSLRGESKS